MKLIVGVHVGRELLNAIENARGRLWICTPFIGKNVVDHVENDAKVMDR